MRAVSLLIIAGGKSSRLGADKRFVEVGGLTLLEKILRLAAAQNFGEIFLCVEAKIARLELLAEKYGAKMLVDEISAAGPLAGIVSGLTRSKNPWALAVSADMPFFDFEIFSAIELPEVLAVVPEVGGRLQMLGAFYHKAAAGIFAQELSRGQRKILDAIKKIPHQILELDAGAEIFFNVNTPADLRLARGRAENLARKVPVVSIVAPCSGTGKTTFIEKLTRNLSERLKIGVIKSDAHGFNLDVAGKDSDKFQKAGAAGVAVVSPDGWFMTQKTDGRADFNRIAEKFDGVDLILTESRTHGIFPAVSIWRGLGEVIADEKVAAIFSSEPVETEEIFRADLNDEAAAVAAVLFLAGFKAGDFFAK